MEKDRRERGERMGWVAEEKEWRGGDERRGESRKEWEEKREGGIKFVT